MRTYSDYSDCSFSLTDSLRWAGSTSLFVLALIWPFCNTRWVDKMGGFIVFLCSPRSIESCSERGENCGFMGWRFESLFSKHEMTPRMNSFLVFLDLWCNYFCRFCGNVQDDPLLKVRKNISLGWWFSATCVLFGSFLLTLKVVAMINIMTFLQLMSFHNPWEILDFWRYL